MRARATSILSLAIVVCLLGAAPSAQWLPPQSLEDQVLGWIRIYDYKAATQPVTQDHRVYSPAQISVTRLFTTWMQASYLPKGALGDVLQTRNAKLSPYNPNTAAEPNAYGAIGKLYTFLKYDANKKLVPVTSDATTFAIEANAMYGTPADAISTPERTYFTLPTFEQQGFGTDLDIATDVSRHPVLGQFPTVYQRNSVSGNKRLVVLTRDHRIPFVKVTRGEYLQAMESAVARKYDTEKQKIARENVGNQKSIDYFMGYLNRYHEKRLAVLKSNKEKYKARLQETAEIFTLAPDTLLENIADVFEGNGGGSKRLAVYTVDPKVVELCKTDAPQWIVIYWTAQLNDPVSKSLHDAMLNNFNFQYVYDYFFDPDKVKGQPYTPLRSPSFTEAAVAGKASAAATTSAADPSVVFFEDFSSSAVGKKPLNWHSTLDNKGASSVVSELTGLNGHWASMANTILTAPPMKAPLPSDFEVSYDVVAAQNYTWGAHAMNFKLSRAAAPGKGESFLNVKIRPSFAAGRDGELEVEGQFPGTEGYLSRSMYAKALGFSNDQVNNRVTVTLKKKGELLQVFIGKTKVAEYEKAIPAALQFTGMSFALTGVSAADKMFISNIRIAKN
jgi:hypothetical protein